ncbi:MAG TPA: MFS transporter [Gaiellaceae bacterium]|nr:MFS transporter [Gaiellaceae bacterium]
MTALAETSGRHGALAALRLPVYRWWFGSQILSASGNMAQGVGLAWLVLELHGHGLALGAMSAALFGPALLASAWAGALVDHVDHRRVLIATQLLFVAVSTLLGVLTATGAIRLWALFLIALVSGFVFAVDAPARQVYVVELVGRERIASAVSLFEVIVNASRVLGPATGGVLIATVGVSICFFVNAASFLPPLYVLLRFRPAEARQPSGAGRGLAAVREGLRYVWRTPAIRASVLMAVASGMLFNLGVALPLLATRVFHLGSVGYGALVATFGLGAIPGALVAAGGGAWPSGRRVRLLCALTGVVVVAVAYAPTVATAYAAMAVAGFLSIWFIALANTLVQLRTESRFRGRVMGVWTMALPGMNPVTAIAAGAVTQVAGARAGFGLGGAALIAAALAGWAALAD